ncbi:hypothetical protein ATH84_10924 [Paracoccus versutus]|uniref:Uncharacterized protein n=1 Tax=Paracoccus versutus TaxID=34007 RepID=A0AAQ0HCU2_PARVE|nr:hypothetical protein [Paracoccus versutus]REG26349.1 hypothetical protein ATH84_10924 [Paracoccus versutus]
MATVTHVRTLDYVARMLGEDPELLEAIVSNDDNLSYGASISVHTGPDDTIITLTDDGIDEPKDMLTAARITTKTWHAFLDDFVDDQKIVTCIKAQSPREQSAGYAACRRMPAENLRAPVLSADGFGVRLTLTPKGIDPSAAGLPGANPTGVRSSEVACMLRRATNGEFSPPAA